MSLVSESLPDAPTGYWGLATANIDWCEANYSHSIYIAETFNTLSNLIYIVTAVYGLTLCQRYRTHWMFHCLYLSLLVIGIGSFAFHASLRREMQALDELPMIFCVFVCFYTLWRLWYRRQKKITNGGHDDFDTHGVKAGLVAATIAAITLFYFMYPKIYALFFVAFTGMAIASVILLLKIFFGDHSSLVSVKQQMWEKRTSKEIVVLSACSLLVWTLDHVLCESTNDTFKLHTWWHFLSCMVVCRAFVLMQMAYYGQEHARVNSSFIGRLYPSIDHFEEKVLEGKVHAKSKEILSQC